MNLIIQSSEDMYRAFLRGIRKENTSVIKPAYWNPFINEEIIKWVKSKLPLVEFNQKRIDDLGVLRVVTDGSTLNQGFTPINQTVAGEQVFLLPSQYTQISESKPYSGIYPMYLHGLNAMFRKGIDDPINQVTTYTPWMGAKILRSDNTATMSENPFREALPGRLYFERIGNEIRLVGDEGVFQMRLEYVRYPKIVQYSATDSWDPEFSPSQCQEIVDQAVRSYLERIVDPRYKSFLQEQMIQSQNN